MILNHFFHFLCFFFLKYLNDVKTIEIDADIVYYSYRGMHAITYVLYIGNAFVKIIDSIYHQIKRNKHNSISL